MSRHQFRLAWVILAGWAACVNAAPRPACGRLPLERLPASVRDQVRQVTEQPTLTITGPVEEFTANPEMYRWLLDHPDRASLAWQRLGFPCQEITEQGPGKYRWADEHGTELTWETVYRSPDARIWYAAGNACPAPWLPAVPVRAVAVLRYSEQPSPGGAIIRHQADMFLQTDSTAAAVAAKVVGPAAPRLTEQCVMQLETFFSALTRYLARYPEEAAILLAESGVRSQGPGVRSQGSGVRSQGSGVRNEKPEVNMLPFLNGNMSFRIPQR